MLSAEPDTGLEPTNHEIITQAKIKSQMLNQLNHPGAPCLVTIFDLKSILSELGIATPVLFWLHLHGISFSILSFFNLYVSLDLNCYFIDSIKTTNF